MEESRAFVSLRAEALARMQGPEDLRRALETGEGLSWLHEPDAARALSAEALDAAWRKLEEIRANLLLTRPDAFEASPEGEALLDIVPRGLPERAFVAEFYAPTLHLFWDARLSAFANPTFVPALAQVFPNAKRVLVAMALHADEAEERGALARPPAWEHSLQLQARLAWITACMSMRDVEPGRAAELVRALSNASARGAPSVSAIETDDPRCPTRTTGSPSSAAS